MTPITPQPAPEVLSLVRDCSPHILPAQPEDIARAFAPPVLEDEPTAEQLESVYETTRQLCDEGNFKFASALALHLVTYKPAEPRYGFIAGTCMQRIGLYSSAARFFCFSLVNGGDNPATLFRLGECLLALGDNVNAERAFDAALDVAREVDGAEELQVASQELMQLIQSGVRAQGHFNS